MADNTEVTDRLVAATVLAEKGAKIYGDSANGPANTFVSTDSGPLPTLAELQRQYAAALGGPNIQALAGLTGSADQLPYFIGQGALSLATITARARTLLASATRAQQIAAIGTRYLASEIVTPLTMDDGIAWGSTISSGAQGNGNKGVFYSLVIEDDHVSQVAGQNNATGSKVEGVGVRHKFGGAGTKGGRHGIGGVLQQVAPTDPDNTDANYVHIQGHVITVSGDNGTASASKGAYFPLSGFCAIISNAYYVKNSTGCEFNSYIEKGVGALAGKRVEIRTGIQIADYLEERGYGLDTAISLGTLSPSPFGHKYGIVATNVHGGYAFSSDSTVVRIFPSASSSATIDGVIDVTGLTVGSLVKSNKTVLGDGNLALTDPNSNLILGSQATAGTPALLLRSSGTAAAYGARVIATGGTSVVGSATMQFDCSGGIMGGTVWRPSQDNTLTVGSASFRPSQYFAVNTTISTSDGREKKILGEVPYGLDFIERLKTIQFKWKKGDGSVSLQESGFEVVEVDVTEDVEVDVVAVEFIDGVATQVWSKKTEQRVIYDEFVVHDSNGNPVETPYDIEVPATEKDSDGNEVLDENGKPVIVVKRLVGKRIETMKVARKKKIQVPVQVEVAKYPEGVRVHYGLHAQQVRQVMDDVGLDDAAIWTLDNPDDPDSRQGLRYDQFIPILINSVKELSQKVKDLEAKLNA